jgi:hypothetical protein
MVDWKYKNPTLYATKIIVKATGMNPDCIPDEVIEAKVRQLQVKWLLKGVNCEVIERHQNRHE